MKVDSLRLEDGILAKICWGVREFSIYQVSDFDHLSLCFLATFFMLASSNLLALLSFKPTAASVIAAVTIAAIQ